jgi:hypothetical protein
MPAAQPESETPRIRMAATPAKWMRMLETPLGRDETRGSLRSG